MLKGLVFCSPVGGAGCSTLAAVFAGALAAKGWKIKLADASPKPGLASLLFQPSEDQRRALSYPWWEVERLQFKQWPDRKSLWSQLRDDEVEIVLLDASGWTLSQVMGSLHERSEACVVLRPDAPSYAGMRHWYSRNADWAQAVAVLNQFEPMYALQQDIYQLMRADFADVLLPQAVHRDPIIPEALAAGLQLREHAAGHQVLHDVDNLMAHLLPMEQS